MYKLYNGDCLELMKELAPGSVDMVLCDLPYGTTQNKWDTPIPFAPMWALYLQVAKHNAAHVMFGAEPFSSTLRVSNLSNYKYDWIWQKDKATGHLNAKKMPMRLTEQISVFYASPCIYNPQIVDKDPANVRPPTKQRKNTGSYGDMSKPSVRGIPVDKSYPNNILKFRGCFGDKGKSNHPTEKPAALMEYLIRTYTNEGDTVLDNCMGSGTTGVACANTGRKFIGMEKDTEHGYYAIATRRIAEAYAKYVTPTQVATPIAEPIPSQLRWESVADATYTLRISDTESAQIGRKSNANAWEVTAYIAGQKYRGERAELSEAFTVADNLVITKAPHYVQAAQ